MHLHLSKNQSTTGDADSEILKVVFEIILPLKGSVGQNLRNNNIFKKKYERIGAMIGGKNNWELLVGGLVLIDQRAQKDWILSVLHISFCIL